MRHRLGRQPLVTAVIVSYRSRDATTNAIASLAPAYEQGILNCIVVDNASNDGTVEHVRRHHSWAAIIVSRENVGFGRGCNLAISCVRTPYVLLINPDAVLPACSLLRLLDFMDAVPRAGMAAPATRTPDGKLQHAGGTPSPLQVLREAWLPGWLPPTRTVIRPGSEPFRTDWLCGAVLLLRTAMLHDIGDFDPRFFLYFEETDLCRRAVARGWELWAVGQAVAEHVCGVSARATGSTLFHGCIAEHYFRSRFQYLVKHHGYGIAVMTEVVEMVIITLVSLVRMVTGRDIAYCRTRLRSPMFGLPARSPEPRRA
jgi:GT2 family glycosyltransferase